MIVIREIFDGANELFENELELAFEYGCSTIVIEPCRLGEQTARWIFFGEYLNKYSLITGLGSIISILIWPEKIFIQYSLLSTALLAHSMYFFSWQQDLSSNYRVEKNPEQFFKKITLSVNKSEDNVSLRTSTNEYSVSPYPEMEEIDTEENNTDKREIEFQKNISSGQHRDQPLAPLPVNPYELILKTSSRKQKPPIILCRRNNNEIRRSNLINAAVSLLAIAFSLIRLVRSSFLSSTPYSSPPTFITSKWPFSSFLF